MARRLDLSAAADVTSMIRPLDALLADVKAMGRRLSASS
jgi:hypothetical protein